MATRARIIKALASTLAVGLAISLSGCSRNAASVDNSSVTITVGSLSGFDNQVIAQIYGQALADAGYRVDYNPGVGSRAAVLTALQDGVVDVVPDYAGLLLKAVSPASDASSTDTIVSTLPLALNPLGLSILTPSTAQNSRVLVVTSTFAQAHAITSIGDLAPISKAIAIGSSEPMEASSYGRRPLEFSYGVTDWAFRSAPDDETVVEDLLANSTQVADLSTVDPAIDKDGLIELKDPAHLIGAQNLVPVVRNSVASENLSTVLNRVSAEIDTADLATFAKRDGALPSTVATQWLSDHHLLSGS